MALIDRTDVQSPVSMRRTALGESSFGEKALALFAATMIIGLLLPAGVLAFAGCLLVAAGFAHAGLVWWRGSATGAASSAWDVPGLLVLLGFAALTLCRSGLALV
ncbi:MAG: hypothetical protein AB7O57_10385 [Hyphomicrobiaceae bacterium]